MKVIIVGASGRIGSQVTKALHKRHEVIQVGRKSGDIQCDYTNEQSVRSMFQKPVNLTRSLLSLGEIAYSSVILILQTMTSVLGLSESFLAKPGWSNSGNNLLTITARLSSPAVF